MNFFSLMEQEVSVRKETKKVDDVWDQKSEMDHLLEYPPSLQNQTWCPTCRHQHLCPLSFHQCCRKNRPLGRLPLNFKTPRGVPVRQDSQKNSCVLNLPKDTDAKLPKNQPLDKNLLLEDTTPTAMALQLEAWMNVSPDLNEPFYTIFDRKGPRPVTCPSPL